MNKSIRNIFYVYVYLDPRKPGDYIYGEYHFDYEPFYVGKGRYNRLYIHLKKNIYNPHFHNKIKKIQKMIFLIAIIIYYKINLNIYYKLIKKIKHFILKNK